MTVAAGLVLLTGMAVAQPTATVSVFVDNRTDASVDVYVDGEQAPDAVHCSKWPTCIRYGEDKYPSDPSAVPLSCGPGRGVCGTFAGLSPGAWIHRMRVAVPGSDTQEQAQRSVVVAGDPVASNVVVWTVYPRSFLVTTLASDDGAGSLRAALSNAAAYATSAGSAFVGFSRAVFQGAAAPQTIDLKGSPCAPDSQDAAICFDGNGVVVDGIDQNAAPGAIVWSVGTNDASLLRVYGGNNIFRGIIFDGSHFEPCSRQRDTVAITGAGASGNRIEQSVILGPTCGDALSVQFGATGNVIAASRISRAADKGVKVDFGGAATIERSCVYNNQNDGIQSTLGGHVIAIENVVQHNLGGKGQDGIVVGDQCSHPPCVICPEDNPNCVDHRRTTLVTEGNVVRFSGGRGLSVRDDADAMFRHDYVANNAVKGSVVETTVGVPLDANGAEQIPSASFHGVGVVCNGVGPLGDYNYDNRGVGAEIRADADGDSGESWHEPPLVTYGNAQEPGRNAFTSNRNRDNGINFLLTNVPGLFSAIGNQWGSCSGDTCVVSDVFQKDVSIENDPSLRAQVALAGAGLTTFDGPRKGNPHIDRVTPPRPRAGDIVRIYGDGFDAVNGNPTRNLPGQDCRSVGLRACFQNGTCLSGPCVDGVCPCSIENPTVRDRNIVKEANHVRIIALDGAGAELADIAPDAVTPTMIAFQMPWDCFGRLELLVSNWKNPGTPMLNFCDPEGCQDAPADTPCDDGRSFTIGDRCDGEGNCVGDSVSTTSTTIIPPSTSSTSSTITTTTTTTLLRVCNLTVPSLTEIAACGKPGLRHRAERKLIKIEAALSEGRQPRCRRVRRLRNLLRHCE